MQRNYYLCNLCNLIFVGRSHLPTAREEEERYRQHQNNDTGEYRAFLARLTAPLVPKLARNSRGLDFGAGPEPVLARMLTELGFEVASYDPLFQRRPELLNVQYDFVTCSETAEHFHYPAREFERLAGLLKPGGWLAIMTQMLSDGSTFPNWYYPRDPTHVSFFSPQTMTWLADRYSWHLERPSPHVSLFQAKP